MVYFGQGMVLIRLCKNNTPPRHITAIAKFTKILSQFYFVGIT